MNDTFIAYLLYLAIAVPLTIAVARTLHRHGALFLRDVFAVNHLLVVGFYLVNLGYVSLFLRTDETVAGGEGVLELVSKKVGIVAIVLGLVHLTNVWVLNRLRRNAAYANDPTLPLTTDEFTTVDPVAAAR